MSQHRAVGRGAASRRPGPTEQTRSLRYRPELDGLRALAVLLVVVHHCLQPHRFAGFVGVDMFFVLSGYLITSILTAELHRRGGIRLGLFYAKRLLRLYPALLLMLVITLPFARWTSAGFGVQARYALYAATYTGNLEMTYRHHWLGPYTHTWSLALEEQYYLVWPLVLLVALRAGVPRRVLAGLVFALGCGAAAIYAHDFGFGAISYPVQATSAGLLVGSALALALGSPGSGARLRRALTAPAAGWTGAALLLAVLVGLSATRALPDGAYLPVAIAASALLISGGAATGMLTRTLSWAPAVALGRISYGVYLWHYPVVILLLRTEPGWSWWGRLLVVTPVAIGAATISYHVVETPFLQWKNRLGRSPDDVPTPGHTAYGAAQRRKSTSER